MPPVITVNLSFLAMRRLNFLALQKKNKIMPASKARNAMVTEDGSSMNLPRTPEVLMKSMAKLNSIKFPVKPFFTIYF